jgi:prepilin-type N-terminal cleavage/methylation domain-containing protein
LRARPGFTLIELLVVLVLLSITAVAAVPAFTAARRDPDRAAADSIVALLTRARDGARERGTRAELVIAPRDARFWLDAGATVETGALDATQHLVGSDSERVICTFSAVGTASPCAIAVRGAADIIVRVNPWTGAITTGVNER